MLNRSIYQKKGNTYALQCHNPLVSIQENILTLSHLLKAQPSRNNNKKKHPS